MHARPVLALGPPPCAPCGWGVDLVCAHAFECDAEFLMLHRRLKAHILGGDYKAEKKAKTVVRRGCVSTGAPV